MKIIGFEKLTLVDYPEKVAAILFTGGCNMRCPYCHNGELVLHPDFFPPFSDDEIFSYLKKRKGVLDAVVISGGEPTLQSGLKEYVKKIKDTGLLVKLDTNGYRPDVMRKAVEEELADYIAMDIKNSIGKYGLTAGIANFNISPILESISYLAEDNIPYEFRTTVVHELHSEEDFHEIGKMCSSCHSYFLQTFSDKGDIIGKNLTAPTPEEMESYITILRKYIGNVLLRDR